MSEPTRNLYRVATVGLGIHYVVATDPTTAYRMIRDWFDAEDYGIDSKRQLVRVELVAATGRYPDGTDRLWIQEWK